MEETKCDSGVGAPSQMEVEGEVMLPTNATSQVGQHLLLPLGADRSRRTTTAQSTAESIAQAGKRWPIPACAWSMMARTRTPMAKLVRV